MGTFFSGGEGNRNGNCDGASLLKKQFSKFKFDLDGGHTTPLPLRLMWRSPPFEIWQSLRFSASTFLSNMTYLDDVKLTWRQFVVLSDWTIRLGNSSGNLTKIYEDLTTIYLIRQLVYRVHLGINRQHRQVKRHDFKLLHRKTSLVQTRVWAKTERHL